MTSFVATHEPMARDTLEPSQPDVYHKHCPNYSSSRNSVFILTLNPRTASVVQKKVPY